MIPNPFLDLSDTMFDELPDDLKKKIDLKKLKPFACPERHRRLIKKLDYLALTRPRRLIEKLNCLTNNKLSIINFLIKLNKFSFSQFNCGINI